MASYHWEYEPNIFRQTQIEQSSNPPILQLDGSKWLRFFSNIPALCHMKKPWWDSQIPISDAPRSFQGVAKTVFFPEVAAWINWWSSQTRTETNHVETFRARFWSPESWWVCKIQDEKPRAKAVPVSIHAMTLVPAIALGCQGEWLSQPSMVQWITKYWEFMVYIGFGLLVPQMFITLEPITCDWLNVFWGIRFSRKGWLSEGHQRKYQIPSRFPVVRFWVNYNNSLTWILGP